MFETVVNCVQVEMDNPPAGHDMSEKDSRFYIICVLDVAVLGMQHGWI